MEQTRTFIERMCEVASDAFLCADRQGLIFAVNDHLCFLMGYSREELIGQKVEKLLPQSIREDHVKWRDGFFARPTVKEMGKRGPLSGLRKDGEVIPLEIGLSPFPTREGLVVLCHIRDMRPVMAQQRAKEVAEERFRLLCSSGTIGILIFSLKDGLEYINPYAANLLGCPASNETATQPATNFQDLASLISKKSLHEIRIRYKRLIEVGYAEPWRMSIRNMRGETIPLMLGMTAEPHDPKRLLAYVLDLRPLEMTERALEESQRKLAAEAEELQKILDSLPVNIAVLDSKGVIQRVNRAWRDFANAEGFPPDRAFGVGDNYMDAFCPVRRRKEGEGDVDILQAYEGLSALRNGQIQQFSQDYACHAPAVRRWFTMLGARLGPKDGDGMVIAHVNITDKKLIEEELQRNALFDSLTGLPNRNLFLSRLDHAIQRSTRQASFQYAILFLDLDRFKNVNDGLGHQMGDLLLKEVALRLRGAVRAVDTVGRLGGDEFVVLLEDLLDSGVTDIIAERIQRAITRAYDLNGTIVRIGASIGIAQGSPQYSDAGMLLRNADAAMYAAKETGRGGIAKFDDRLHEQAMRRLQIEADLSQALDRNELELCFQPIINIQSGSVCAFEALMRWRHAQRGMISPMDFIPIAEDSGLIVKMGHWLIHECVRQRREWLARDARFAGIKTNLNLSPKQFLDPELTKVILSACRLHDCRAEDLSVEITEGVVMENFSAATLVLGQLKAVNSSILLDDFGTGYSSLAYVHKFPVDGLKIDRSFVAKMHEDQGTRKIIRGIIGLARDLNLTVTAEGVERVEHLAELRSLGCDFAQGYYFSAPVLAADAASLAIRHFV